MQQRLEVLLCMQDDQFRQILANDPIIENLEKQKFNPQSEYWELMQILSGKSSLNDLVFNPLTLSAWSFLYSIKNTYVVGGTITEKDTDIFLYILHHGLDNITDDLFEDSKDFCVKNNIEYIDAKLYILEMIQLSFRPLQMLPKTNSDEKSRFNTEWFTSIASIVYKQIGADRLFIYHKMSLIQVFSHVVNHLKQNDVKNQIKRRNSAEIDAEIYKRTYYLGELYYQSKYKETYKGR